MSLLVSLETSVSETPTSWTLATSLLKHLSLWPSAVLPKLFLPYALSSSSRGLLSVPGACLENKGGHSLGPVAVRWWSWWNWVSRIRDLFRYISIMCTDLAQQRRQTTGQKNICLSRQSPGRKYFQSLWNSVVFCWEAEGITCPSHVWIPYFHGYARLKTLVSAVIFSFTVYTF